MRHTFVYGCMAQHCRDKEEGRCFQTNDTSPWRTRLADQGTADHPPPLVRVGTMPHFEFEGTGYVLQADVDAFNEACQCRNQKV
jgi:hypothetical protein